MALRIGQQAPVIAGAYPDTDGRPRTLAASLARGPVLLGIYKSSCQASKTVFPFLERLNHRHAGQGLDVLGVSQDSANIARSFSRRVGLTFPILIDGDDYPISRAFDTGFTPTVYLIRPDGTIAFVAEGFLRDQIVGLGDAVAGELRVSLAPLIAETETDVPFFVPG